jgi:hypothetical protein
MDTRKESQPQPLLVRPAGRTPGARRTRGTVRTCIPARSGQGGYREPADSEDTDAHIVRGED